MVGCAAGLREDGLTFPRGGALQVSCKPRAVPELVSVRSVRGSETAMSCANRCTTIDRSKTARKNAATRLRSSATLAAQADRLVRLHER